MDRTVSAKERLAFLDVARGLATLLVLTEHGLDACLPNALRSTVGFGYLGRAGVILFLVISGFIIPASLEAGGSNARFWLRRLFRLFPAYWLSIAIAALCVACGRPVGNVPAADTGDWLLNLTMLQTFCGRPSVWGVFWTLQLELIIYAACSVLYSTGLLRHTGAIAAAALAILAVLGFTRPLIVGKEYDVAGARLLYFAALAGLVAQRQFVGIFSRRVLLAFLAGHIGFVAAIWGVNHWMFPERVKTEFVLEFLWTWGLAYLGFFALLSARSRRMPALATWLGRISYSVYLLHPAVIALVAPLAWPAWAFLPVFLLGTLGLADLTYRLVELPGIALGRAVERRWMPAKSTASQAPIRRAA